MKLKINMTISIILMFISSFSLVIIPFSDFNGTKFQILLANLVGIIFWSCLVVAWIMQFIFSSKINYKSKKFGLIRFFDNKYAIIFDIIMILFFVATVILLIISEKTNIPELVIYIFISVFIFSLQMHCVCNGKNFKYILKSKFNGGEITNEK